MTDVGQPGRSGQELAAVRAALSLAEREVVELRSALATARAREQVLVHEVQHRVRNMLAVIRSILCRTRESGASQEEFADHFEGRLGAIARYHSHVDHLGSGGIELEDMLRDELLEGHCLDGPNCMLSGPPVHLRGKPAELMGLAIHELTTNSIKFGALAQGGKLKVEWSADDSGDGKLLRFDWIEAGVAMVGAAPRPSGFGQQLIQEALPYQLGAKTSFGFKPGGFACSILLPLPGTGPDQGGYIAGESILLPLETEQGR